MPDVEAVVDDPIIKIGDKWCATIDLGDGSPAQKFYGDTKEEVIKELLKAQTNATKTIREQKKKLKLERPDAPRQIPEFRPRELTAAEKLKLATDVNDPAKAAEAIKRAIEAELGADAATIRKTLASVHATQERAKTLEEVNAFLGDHPEFKRCPENESLMFEYLNSRNMGITLKNLDLAFDDLRDHLVLHSAPSQATVTRPRGSASTGIPASAASSRPAPAKPIGLTVAELNRMSASEYKQKLSDPQFRSAVERLYAR